MDGISRKLVILIQIFIVGWSLDVDWGFFNHKINKKTRKLLNFEPPKVGQS